eukprot:1336855-Rhodomonas_salina.2
MGGASGQREAELAAGPTTSNRQTTFDGSVAGCAVECFSWDGEWLGWCVWDGRVSLVKMAHSFFLLNPSDLS